MTHNDVNAKCPKCNHALTFNYVAKCVFDLNDVDFLQSFDINDNTTYKQMREIIETNEAHIYYCEKCEMHVIMQDNEL